MKTKRSKKEEAFEEMKTPLEMCLDVLKVVKDIVKYDLKYGNLKAGPLQQVQAALKDYRGMIQDTIRAENKPSRKKKKRK